ncbi:MAG: glycerol-3-phosphate 1-O-acyltransferase PlsY [Motiliproteus sp.]|nr:glycerol-3-phosphate 1-O-acyltransferase PlsY [Motiliproteus sp.]MCW9053064.1 glycerol-3-phosphate 1-O-acyltransferase PlsY [Motiliproteus sp.]
MFHTLTSTDLLAITFAYLLGSISSAVLVSRLFALEDPRRHGSGNPGATNMLRTGNRTAALLTLFGDLTKGYIAVYLAVQLELSNTAVGLVALAAVIGHLLPLFFKFKGGKGVATTLGVCLAFSPWLGLSQILIWLPVAALSRTSSVAALATALMTPLLSYWLIPSQTIICTSIAALMIARHHRNLKNLINGQEHRL